MDHATLNNGVEMPILGFGVYQIPAEETEQAVADLTTQLAGLEADLARTEIDLSNTEARLEDQAVAMYMEASAMPAILSLSH